MNTELFNDILEDRISAIKETIESKADEYATNDRLYNFKRAGELLRESPGKALMGMLVKQFICILDMVEGTTTPTGYLINEKIGDTINYLILLEAILKEGK